MTPEQRASLVRSAARRLGAELTAARARKRSRTKLVVDACMSTLIEGVTEALELAGRWRQAVETGHGREDISAARLALGARSDSARRGTRHGRDDPAPATPPGAITKMA